MVTRFARDSQITDNQEGKVAPAYLAEVIAHTERREREYVAAARRLEAARRRHAKALAAQERGRASNDLKRAVQIAWELVEERTRELRVLASLMTEVPASRVHRGTGQAQHKSS